MSTTQATFVTETHPDDLPAASQSTLLLQKKKEMAEVQQQLDRKKDEFRQRMERCQEKEVDLAAKQEHIKEQVRKFDKFLKDNDAKRVRASRKAAEEEKLREQKEVEKLELMKLLEEQLRKKNALADELSRKAVYQEYLDNLCDTSEYFEGIENITMRYETLEQTNKDLQERIESAQQEAEDLVPTPAPRTSSPRNPLPAGPARSRTDGAPLSLNIPASVLLWELLWEVVPGAVWVGGRR